MNLRWKKKSDLEWILTEDEKEINRTSSGLGILVSIEEDLLTCLHKIGDLEKLKSQLDSLKSNFCLAGINDRIELLDLSSCSEEDIEDIWDISVMSLKAIQRQIPVKETKA